VEIYLFGSHAWGTPHDDSDVDIMVIVSESSEPPIKRTTVSAIWTWARTYLSRFATKQQKSP
jgi:Polymerase beta, Nucleotidyltransferase